MRALPERERRERLAEIGAETFDRDVGNFAAELRWNTRSLDHLWPPAERDALLRRHVQFLFAGVSDAVEFMDPDASTRVAGRAVLSGLEHPTAALEAGRAVLLLGAYHCHPSFALLHPALHAHRIVGIQHSEVAGSAVLPLTRDGRVYLLPASRASMRTIVRVLQGGGCVAFYNDYVFDGVVPVRSTLFGRPVLTSRAIVSLALRTGAAVFPFTVARQFPLEDEDVRVEFFPELPLPRAEEPWRGRVEAAALLFGMVTECLVRRHPAQWRLWNSLEHRWRQAALRPAMPGRPGVAG